VGEGFGGVRAHEAFQAGRRDPRPPAASCPHPFLEGADRLVQISGAGGDGLADIDTVMRAVETVSAYFNGAIRREIANLRAERATGLSKRDWQRASGPHVTRMLATGRFPALAKAVYDSTDMDAEASFVTGLDWVLDAVAARLVRPPT
jgi:Tetracyclin repressor-like, C-terminal domain